MQQQPLSYVQTAGETAGFDIMSFLPLIGIFLIFYFLLLRPQQKKMKQHQEMLSKLKRGDRVVTSGGIMGTIFKIVNDQEVQVEIAENVRVRVARSMISSVDAKTHPVTHETTHSSHEKADKPEKTEKTEKAETSHSDRRPSHRRHPAANRRPQKKETNPQ